MVTVLDPTAMDMTAMVSMNDKQFLLCSYVGAVIFKF